MWLQWSNQEQDLVHKNVSYYTVKRTVYCYPKFRVCDATSSCKQVKFAVKDLLFSFLAPLS